MNKKNKNVDTWTELIKYHCKTARWPYPTNAKTCMLFMCL